MFSCNHCGACLGILIFSLFSIHQLQTTNAQLKSDIVYHNITSDRNSLNYSEPSSETISWPSNFSDESIYFISQAHEAAMSRLWEGIHFPQDNNNVFAIGQQIGKKYVNDMLNPPHPFVIPLGEVLTAPSSWKNNNNNN